ncbi:MAG: hypothetical protein J07HB67_02060 [halophilic archaeon J07HB67]|jgi:hypothetical protein|nr:MAG: hypothetical protein J07HB67_02060 [halophilic archaeon J07HB67]
MSSNDSPPQKRGGATDAERREQTIGGYETAIGRLQETRVPESRQDALVGACNAVQDSLQADDETVSTDELMILTAVTAEAINDVREAKTVGVEEDLPVGRRHDVGVPTEEYVLTTAEREEALGVLSNLLLLAVDTDSEYSEA